MMELLRTENYYILSKDEDSLWFSRHNGSVSCKTIWDLAYTENPVCLGLVYAFLGKIQLLPDASPRICLVVNERKVGCIDGTCSEESAGDVFCITKVVFLPLTTTPDCDLNLQFCHKHHTQHPKSLITEQRKTLAFGDLQSKVGLSKTFGTIRNVTSSLKTATANVAASATGQNKYKRDGRDKERFERRILDELYKMFNESDSFYYSHHVDLTSSLQQRTSQSYCKDQPLWKRADPRFFWNMNMLLEFTDGEIRGKIPDSWLIPIIQGFVQIETIPIESTDSVASKNQQDHSYTLALISRRSRKRAGTRYKRRGIDEEGNVANYVESEQIITFSHHRVAFVQVRGSVPLFWSQPGYKYRPPPRLDKKKLFCGDESLLPGAEGTASAFQKHFENELEIYNRIICISLVEQGGKEKIIADAYLDQVFSLNSPAVTYIAFDFHEYCRGMRYENVSVLIEGIKEIMSETLYCWVDKEGRICKQTGIFRINCIDCLDRTNVLQTALAKAVLENQFVKLGIIIPEQQLPLLCRSTLQVMWANNGDIISKQYAGTSALKGDFTRTGERKFTGLMKDGMNSANRYYKNRFKDAYRQATIDAMLGNPITEDLINLNPDLGEEEDSTLAQHVKHVIDDCKTLLVPDAETILGAWGLIDADPVTGDSEQTDMDTILVLTRDSYYVAQYEEEADRISNFERVSLIDLDIIETGHYTFQGMFKQSRTYFCIRLSYQVDGQSGYFHMLRSMNVRFFNNMAVSIKTEEEILESMKAVADTFELAVQMVGCDVKLLCGKLDKRRSRRRTQNPLHLLMPIASFTRKSPDSLKSVGTRAFSNVTSGLAKLNPMASLRFKKVDDGTAKKSNSQFHSQPPVVSVINASAQVHGVKDSHFPSCGIVYSCATDPNGVPRSNSPLLRCCSDSALSKLAPGTGDLTPIRSMTPEIMVSEDAPEIPSSQSKMPTHHNFLTTSLASQRVRKLSHSSDDVDPREEEQERQNNRQRASSATELDLPIHLASSQSEGKFSSRASTHTHLISPLSPLGNLNKDMVLAPFSVLARGVQSLAPGAGKLARGVQNIGGNVDPRKLKLTRQKELESNAELNERKANCRSNIILF